MSNSKNDKKDQFVPNPSEQDNDNNESLEESSPISESNTDKINETTSLDGPGENGLTHGMAKNIARQINLIFKFITNNH